MIDIEQPSTTKRGRQNRGKGSAIVFLLAVAALSFCLQTRESSPSPHRNDPTHSNAVEKSVCKITPNLLPPIKQSMSLEYGKSARILFLLGYPYTGTSATHYLLSTSSNVSTLRPDKKSVLSPTKEGWQIIGLKRDHPYDRWFPTGVSNPWLNITLVAEKYWKLWDKSKKLLIENSPPEIQHPQELMNAFSKYGKVRFLLLVRGECSNGDKHQYHHSNSPLRQSRVAGYKRVVDLYPAETFVLRYEDLCLRWNEVYKQLVRWEPLLADIDITSVPASEKTTRHEQMSIEQFCNVKRLAWKTGVEQKCLAKGDQEDLLEQSAMFGYDKIDEQIICG